MLLVGEAVWDAVPQHPAHPYASRDGCPGWGWGELGTLGSSQLQLSRASLMPRVQCQGARGQCQGGKLVEASMRCIDFLQHW